MLKLLQKLLPLISILLVVALLVSIIFYPDSASLLALIVIVFSLGIAVFAIVRKRLKAQTTRIETTRNILLDILGLFLAILAASYCGGKAGVWAGETYGFWYALAAGMVVGFAVAIVVKKAWEKITIRRLQKPETGA